MKENYPPVVFGVKFILFQLLGTQVSYCIRDFGVYFYAIKLLAEICGGQNLQNADWLSRKTRG